MADANLIKGAADMYAGGYQSIGEILDPVFKNIQDALETGIQRREEEERKEREAYEGSSDIEAGYPASWKSFVASLVTKEKNIFGESTIGKGKAEAGSQQWHDYNNSALEAETNIKKLNVQIKAFGGAQEEWNRGIKSGEISKFMSDKDRRWLSSVYAGKITPEYDEASGNLYFERDGERVLIKDLPTPEVATANIAFNEILPRAIDSGFISEPQLMIWKKDVKTQYTGAGGEGRAFDHMFGEEGSLTEVYSSLLGVATEGSSNTTENALSASDKIIGFFKNPSGEEYKNLREHLKEKYGKDIGTTSDLIGWHVDACGEVMVNQNKIHQAAQKSNEKKGKINEDEVAYDEFIAALALNTKGLKGADLAKGITETLVKNKYGGYGTLTMDRVVVDGTAIYQLKKHNIVMEEGPIEDILKALQEGSSQASAGESDSESYNNLGKGVVPPGLGR